MIHAFIDQQLVRDGSGIIHRRLIIAGRPFDECDPTPCRLLVRLPDDVRDAELCIVCWQPRRSGVPEVA
jgi:hypothetical protein